jgi:DNA-binding Lrp family transcriptional regulator
VPPERFESVAAQVNAFPEVAHNYERTHVLNMWFVVSSERPARIAEVIDAISAQTGLEVYPMPKLREFFIGFRVDV